MNQVYENEEDRQTASILSTLIWVSWAAYLVVIFSGLYWNDWELIAITLFSSIFLFLPFWLLKHGHLFSSGYILVLMVLGMVTAIATIGQGIHDVAIMAYPSIIIFASLALNRVGFKIYVVLTLLSMCWLVFGEASGQFVSKSFETPGWVDYLVIATILMVAALAVDLLATNMRKNLELARQEITQRKQVEEKLRESEEKFRTLIEKIKVAVIVHEADTRISTFNSMAQELLGLTEDQLMGKTSMDSDWHFFLDDGLDMPPEKYPVNQVLATHQALKNYVVGVRRPQMEHDVWMLVNADPMFGKEDEIVKVIVTFIDITERKLAEEKLRYQSTHDVLTGIYNRAFFEAELSRLEHSREFETSIIIIDVDKLKVTNDTQGHTVGDEILRHAANVLRLVFREGDVLARIGGDEFAVLLPSTNATVAEQMLTRVKERLTEHNAKHPELPLELSLGTATAKTNNLVEAFTLADQRMYTDKAAHKANTKI